MKEGGSLTKEDLCWVVVKVAGAFLVYQAVATIYGAVVAWWSLRDSLEGLSEQARETAIRPLKILWYSSLLPGAVGLRLLVSGSTLHRVLMAVPLGLKRTRPPSGGSLAERRLSGDELIGFQKWLKDHPEFQERDEIDQLALFRDAQKSGEV
jgi:hypothetical protein